MYTYGKKTPSTRALIIESHKMERAFYVDKPAVGAVPVRKTQPVKLTSTGTVTPLLAADNRNLCIGFSVHDGRPGERVTIAMKAYATLLAKASGAVPIGPVAIAGFDSTNPVGTGSVALPEHPTEDWYGVNTVTTAVATAANIFGIATEAGADGDLIEIVVIG